MHLALTRPRTELGLRMKLLSDVLARLCALLASVRPPLPPVAPNGCTELWLAPPSITVPSTNGASDANGAMAADEASLAPRPDKERADALKSRIIEGWLLCARSAYDVPAYHAVNKPSLRRLGGFKIKQLNTRTQGSCCFSACLRAGARERAASRSWAQPWKRSLMCAWHVATPILPVCPMWWVVSG